MKPAFVALNIKATGEDMRRIEGWATTPEIDRVGDVVIPEGAKFTLPIPFCLDHDTRQAVGDVDQVVVTDKGIKFSAFIKKIDEPGEVKDMCDKAWQLVKNGLRKAVSIGFRSLDHEPMKSGGLKFKSWEWLELSAVTVPAAPGAQITSVKGFMTGETFTTVSDNPEIPLNDVPAATGKQAHIAKLNPARDRAKPAFVPRRVIR